jgi:REase_MTES_1575/Transcriptional regulator, AbiEi antitoxin
MGAGEQQTTRHEAERAVERWAARHYGVFTRTKAIELGVTPGVIRDRLETGRWVGRHRGVYVVAGTPKTWEQDLMIACLVGGDEACASHRAAARLWAFPLRVTAVEISATRKVIFAGAIVHRVRALPACDRATRQAIPVTQPSRTLVDLAAYIDAGELEQALDDALRRGLTTVSRLHWRLDEIGRGKRGCSTLRRLLRERPAGSIAPESRLERRVLSAIANAGLPEPERQFSISDGRRFVARVDFAYPARRLAIEADGYAYHSGRLAWEKDLERRNALEKLGWRVLHVSWRQLDQRPAVFVATLARCLDGQESLFGR